MESLPGIRHIAFVDAEALTPHITLQALAKIQVGIFARLFPISFDRRTALCETETEFDNNSTLETATLTFASSETLPLDRKLCFVITLVNGEQWLLGTHEPPFPFVKKETSSGLPDGDTNIINYTVNYTNKVALVRVFP